MLINELKLGLNIIRKESGLFLNFQKKNLAIDYIITLKNRKE